MGVLHEVCEKERLTLPDELAARIAKASGRNLRRAILALEECKVAQYPFNPSMPVPQPDWEVYIKAIAQDICREQSPARLVATRDKLYDGRSGACWRSASPRTSILLPRKRDLDTSTELVCRNSTTSSSPMSRSSWPARPSTTSRASSAGP